jgi:hypothetical protein
MYSGTDRKIERWIVSAWSAGKIQLLEKPVMVRRGLRCTDISK